MQPKKYIKKGTKLLKNMKKVFKKLTSEDPELVASELKLCVARIEKHIQKNIA